MNDTVWQPVYVGIGSNLAQPVEQVTTAITDLNELAHCTLIAQSRLFRTKPLGPAGQPDYVNAVAGLLTTLEPQALLEQLQAIELAHGRKRAERWSARTLDLDVLSYAQREINSPSLTVPHPQLHNRDFVLGPWLDIAPEFRVAGRGLVAALADQIDLGTLRVIELDAPAGG